MFFFVETILCCYFFNLNPFDQPVVEEGKKLAKIYLGVQVMNKIEILSDDLTIK